MLDAAVVATSSRARLASTSHKSLARLKPAARMVAAICVSLTSPDRCCCHHTGYLDYGRSNRLRDRQPVVMCEGEVAYFQALLIQCGNFISRLLVYEWCKSLKDLKDYNLKRYLKRKTNTCYTLIFCFLLFIAAKKIAVIKYLRFS